MVTDSNVLTHQILDGRVVGETGIVGRRDLGVEVRVEGRAARVADGGVGPFMGGSHLFLAILTVGELSNLSHPVCPYVFKNANLKRFCFANLEKDRMTKHTLSLLPTRNANNLTIDMNGASCTKKKWKFP